MIFEVVNIINLLSMDYQALYDEEERVYNLISQRTHRRNIDLTDLHEEWIKSTELEEMEPYSWVDIKKEDCDACGECKYLFKFQEQVREDEMELDKMELDEILGKYNLQYPPKYVIKSNMREPEFLLLDDSVTYRKICKKCLAKLVKENKAKMIYISCSFVTQFTVEYDKLKKANDEEGLRKLCEFGKEKKISERGLKMEEMKASKKYVQCGGCRLYYEEDQNTISNGCCADIKDKSFCAGYGSIYDSSFLKVDCEWNPENPNICDRCIHKLLLEGKLKYDLDRGLY